MIIVGIDPGTSRTGYAAIEYKRGEAKILEFGCWDFTELEYLERLENIFKKVNQLIKDNKPNLLAIEEVFFFKNAKTVMKISEARGVTLLASKRNKIKILELTPLQVKQYLAGYGRAEKKQVQQLVKKYFDLEVIPKPDDAADALAICIAAICYLEKNT